MSLKTTGLTGTHIIRIPCCIGISRETELKLCLRSFLKAPSNRQIARSRMNPGRNPWRFEWAVAIRGSCSGQQSPMTVFEMLVFCRFFETKKGGKRRLKRNGTKVDEKGGLVIAIIGNFEKQE